jgi:phage-related protein
VATGTLTFDIFARDHASSTFNRFGTSVAESEGAVKRLGSSLALLAKSFAALYVVQKIAEFMHSSVDAANEAAKANAQTAAVIKSTGGVANVTAGFIDKLATSQSIQTGITADEIHQTENLLLTFRNIRNETGKGNDIFTQATKVTEDLSVAMGKSLHSSAILVGKALNAPITGLSSLTRVGVQFTDHQKALITKLEETGHHMEAEKMILRELNAEFKGSAKAQATPADKAKAAWHAFQVEIGTKVLPELNRFLLWFTTKGLPGIEHFVHAVSPVIRELYLDFKSGFNAIKPIIRELYLDFKSGMDGIKAVIRAVTPAARMWARGMSEGFAAVHDVFVQMKGWVTSTIHAIVSVIKGGVAAIKATWHGLTALVGVVTSVFGRVRSATSAAMNAVKSAVSSGVHAAIAAFHQITAIVGVVTSAFSRVVSAVTSGSSRAVAVVQSIPGKMVSALGDLGSLLFGAGFNAMMGFLHGIEAGISSVVAAAQSAASQVAGAISGALQVFSPSRVLFKIGLDTMAGFRDGIAKGTGGVVAATQNMVKKVSDQLDALISKRNEFQSGMVTTFSTNPFTATNAEGYQPTTMGGMFSVLKQARADARKLRRDTHTLIHKGLSRALIHQLASAGPEGLAELDILAHSTAAQVHHYNQLYAQTQGQLQQAANMAGGELFGGSIRDKRKDLHDLAAAVHKGMNGAKIKIVDRHGNANLLLRGG